MVVDMEVVVEEKVVVVVELEVVDVVVHARSLSNHRSECEILLSNAPRLAHQFILLPFVAQQSLRELKTRPRLLQQLLLADVPGAACAKWNRLQIRVR